MPEPNFRPVAAADRDALARFLSEHRWPFHARALLDPAEAAEVVAGWDLEGQSRAWWLERDGRVAGLLRVDDLDTWGTRAGTRTASSTTASATACCARTGSRGRPPRSTGTASSGPPATAPPGRARPGGGGRPGGR
ncbi:MAG TPA: hypothetical protein VJ931_17690 [Actinomycetota bacterium]|nr:hypothetical protein [Actinomycetota bacterium]